MTSCTSAGRSTIIDLLRPTSSALGDAIGAGADAQVIGIGALRLAEAERRKAEKAAEERGHDRHAEASCASSGAPWAERYEASSFHRILRASLFWSAHR